MPVDMDPSAVSGQFDDSTSRPSNLTGSSCVNPSRSKVASSISSAIRLRTICVPLGWDSAIVRSLFQMDFRRI